MKIRFFAAFAILCSFLGCSTIQNVGVGRFSIDKPLTTVAQVIEDGNSSDMNTNLQIALQKQGLNVRPQLPIGTRLSGDVDALVSYTDVWRWDIVMYLQSFTLKVYDAKSGDLLAITEWRNSIIHRFPDSAEVVRNLVAETFNKINANAEKKVAEIK